MASRSFDIPYFRRREALVVRSLSMPHPHLAIETSPAGFRCVRLSRPERRNALDVSLLRAVTDALTAEPGVPVLLTSADPRVFCAGADLTISDAERAAVSDLVYDCCETIVTRPGPVIAVLTGPAVGGGAQLAAAAALRVAGPGGRRGRGGPGERAGAARSWRQRPTCGSRDRGRGCAGPVRPDSTSRWAPGCCPTWS